MAKSKQQVMLEARKEHAKDLRKAHFHFGFKQGCDEQSRYHEDYKEYNLDAAEKTRQEMLKLRNDLRSTHYLLGTDESSKLFNSTAKQSFMQPVNPQVSQLSLETKKDLRSHHFNLGNYDDKVESVYKANYHNKGVHADAFKDRKDQTNALRKHNHDFGDNKNYYSSLYNENYNNSYDPQFLKQGKSKEAIQQEIVDLRKTNLVMGNSKPNLATEAMSEFNTKPQANRQQFDLGLKHSHFQLGDDPINYASITKSNFTGAQLHNHDPNKIKLLSKDLRAEHFSLGDEKRTFKTETADKYKEIEKNSMAEPDDMSFIQKTHFNLQMFGGTDPKTHYVSDYKSRFIQSAQPGARTQARNDRQDRNSNIVLGSDKVDNRFESEAKKNFVNFGEQKATQLEKETKENLRKHHYAFGTDAPTNATEMKASFNDKSKASTKSQLDEELVKDLRRHHFDYGTQKNGFSTTMSDIGKNQGPPSKLDPALAKDLRSHHFKAIDLSKYYKTSYRIDYTDPEAV